MLVLLHVDAPLFWRCGVDEMKTAARILISLLSVVVLVSCNGQGTAPVVNDYRTGIKDPRVRPESLCVGNGRGGWICSGGGGSSVPPIYYGTQGPCAVGYLYFSSGCEDDNWAFAQTYPMWTGNNIIAALLYVFNIHTEHFWNPHLACYLTGSTANQYEAAVAQDFDAQWNANNIPAVGTYKDYPCNMGITVPSTGYLPSSIHPCPRTLS